MEIKQVNMKEGENVLHVLHGNLPEPLPLKKKVSLKIEGSIEAPLQYIMGRDRLRTPEALQRLIVKKYGQDGTIELIEDINDSEGDVVIGKLVINPVFLSMGINDPGKNYGADELRAVARSLAQHMDRSVYVELIEQTRKLKMNVTSTYENEKTNQRTAKSTSHALIEEFSHEFRIKVPLFKGTEPVTISVSLLVDVQAAPRFYFESLDLPMLIKENREHLMNGVLEKLGELGATIITIN